MKEYFAAVNDKSMRYAFTKSMAFNFYFKENVQLKIRLVPMEEKYYVFVMFENIEDKASLLEIHSKLNYSMMLIQSLSHEMFTPLHHVLGISDRLYKKLTEEGNRLKGSIEADGRWLAMREEVLIIKQIGQGLSIFVQNILDFANIVNNTFEVYRRRFKVKDLMEGLLSIFSVKAKQKNIVLRYDCTDGLEMYTDYNRLEGLLFNFLDNSVKFTQRGGVTIHAHSLEGHVVFKVVDTGAGIDEADIKKISDIFKDPFLADKTKASAGLGIGLRISLALIKHLSKGDLAIDISSEKNIGTTIQFEISQNFEIQTPQPQSNRRMIIEEKPTVSPSSKSPYHRLVLDEAVEGVRSLKAVAFHNERLDLQGRVEKCPMPLPSSSKRGMHSVGNDEFAQDSDSFDDSLEREEIDMFDQDDAEVAKHIRKRNQTRLVSISIKHVESIDNGMVSPRKEEEEEEFEYEEDERLESKHPCKY